MNTSENQFGKNKKKSSCRPVYRIIPINRFIELLTEKKNTLVEPYLWNDPLEGWIYNKILEYYKLYEGTHRIPGKFFGQSWTQENKSELMWKIYSNGTDSVRISSTISKLKKSPFENNNDVKWCVKPIDYRSFQSGLQLSELIGPHDGCLDSKISALIKSYMIKREAFKHEDEIRIICHSKNAKSTEKTLKYEICPECFIDEIMMHPGISDSEFKKFKNIFKAYNLTKKVRRSEIYKMPDKIPYTLSNVMLSKKVIKTNRPGKKRDRREKFNQEKLEQSVRKAVYKRPIESDCISQMIYGIISNLESVGGNEIYSEKIKDCVMETLEPVDEIACWRFASYYENFQVLDHSEQRPSSNLSN